MASQQPIYLESRSQTPFLRLAGNGWGLDVAYMYTGVMDEKTTFHLQLNCTSRKSTENKLLSLSSFPSSTLELKQAIESRFSIPVCVQSVSYQLAPLSDGDSLLERRIRSGDTLSVSYRCEADCKLIREIILWIQQVVTAIQSENGIEANEIRTDNIIWGGINSSYHETLPIHIFDWLSPKAFINKLYFETEGGLTALVELYRELTSHDWGSMRPLLKYLESFSIQSIGNFGEVFSLRRISLKAGVLDMVMKSLLRKVLEPGEPIKGFGQTEADEFEDSIWRDVLINAVYITANFSELPECQLQIASHPSVLEQVLHVSKSEKCQCSTSVVVSEIFVCLAHSTATHQYLSKPNILEGLLQVYKKRCENNDKQLSAKDQRTVAALKCFTLLVFAQLALASPHLMPSRFIDTVLSQMNRFLSEIQPDVIRTYEQEQECVWATLLPYIKLFYLPQSQNLGSAQQIQELQCSSERMILFFLHSKMNRQYSCDILIKEGLVDYITALPWHVSVESKASAESVVSELGVHMRLQPPRLCSIVQAKLAKMHFGLKRVVASDSPVDLIRSVYQNTIP